MMNVRRKKRFVFVRFPPLSYSSSLSQAVNKLQEIVTQKNPFAPRTTNSTGQHNLNRRLEQALQEVRENSIFS